MPEVTSTYADGVNAFGALTIMGGQDRVLPSPAADGKTARLMRLLKPHVDEITQTNLGIAKRHVRRDEHGAPVPGTEGKGEQIVDYEEYQLELHAAAQQTFTVEVKDGDLLTAEDLPKDRATKPENGAGRSQLQFWLGPFFAWE